MLSRIAHNGIVNRLVFSRFLVPSSSTCVSSLRGSLSRNRRFVTGALNMPKRKRVTVDVTAAAVAIDTNSSSSVPTRRSSTKNEHATTNGFDLDPDTNPDVKDAPEALRSSPDAAERESKTLEKKSKKKQAAKPAVEIKQDLSDSPLSDVPETEPPSKSAGKPKKAPTVVKKEKQEAVNGVEADPEADGEEEAADPEELQVALSRPPAVNSPYLPLPWKGRLGYCCLNTYLRAATPPIFSSRTCRIASILEHRHPLKDPSQPEHATKNRPDKDQPADIARGQAYVEAIGLANAKDIPKMLKWNQTYGIRFFRLSSEMFPFASHPVYGYELRGFAAEALADAGKVAAELGHRLTTHPGQFTQLGSPRPEVISASLRDLAYHCELLDLLKLPGQLDKDAVMILHMGGIFGDKDATIARFKENYIKLPQKIKDRLVLENDDMCYSVHDLLPVCEELNIPLVLDWHHNNIVFDANHIREGTLDILQYTDRIRATWTRKGITQKMHYSEPCPGAITARSRRKHNPRVYSLPPCSPDMDLMIEAKDKEQAVFEVMRILKLPGFEKINELLPYTRTDENKPWKPPKPKKKPKKKKADEDDEDPTEEPEIKPPPIVPDEEIAMGGPENRVYWPVGWEEWLRPKKREVKPRAPEKAKNTAEKAAERRAEKAAWQAAREASAEAQTDGSSKIKSVSDSEQGQIPSLDIAASKSVYDKAKTSKAKPVRAPAAKGKKSNKAAVPTPSTSDPEEEDEDRDTDTEMPDLTDAESPPLKPTRTVRTAKTPLSRRQSSRGGQRKSVNYAEDED